MPVPTLAIVIPVYNEERYLDACLRSIAAQTVLPAEVIVVDNNCNDGSMGIARSYPFVHIVSEKKQGHVFARNKGYDAVKSDLIGRIDADSILPMDWVERVVGYYENPENDQNALTGSGYFYNIRLPRFTSWLQGQLAFRANRLISGHYILWGSNMAFPRTMWLAVRKDVCLQTDVHEDMDLAIHLHKHGYQIAYRKTLQVGVVLKRVWHDRDDLRRHMRRWPQTLHKHGYTFWWMGSIGNIFLWYVAQPMIYGTEWFSRLVGKPSIKD